MHFIKGTAFLWLILMIIASVIVFIMRGCFDLIVNHTYDIQFYISEMGNYAIKGLVSAILIQIGESIITRHKRRQK
ncbi:hypothetical protein [Lactobacillus sp. Sy-1]|uniref:hypothetical protein n=1 Tax=Lactobacillus sp. Sy-1 TaxID=2109645 RepID=UPI001C55ADEF|nr:hypothetical protein [Lactobacillus sp. Sy-1]MBW1604947.1 hypothetical protein [Lactobacillus sp. Sy-1]